MFLYFIDNNGEVLSDQDERCFVFSEPGIAQNFLEGKGLIAKIKTTTLPVLINAIKDSHGEVLLNPPGNQADLSPFVIKASQIQIG